MMNLDLFNPASLAIIVKIYNVDKDSKNTTASGIITFNTHRPLQNSCGIGEVLKIGRLVRDIRVGDILLFHHGVEASDDRLLERDDDGEIRVVMQFPDSDETFGVVRNNKRGESKIIPMMNRIVAVPTEADHLNYERIMSSVFQIPVMEINSRDPFVQKMGLVRGDWVVVEPYGAYEIEVNRITFWFLHADAILFINKGRHVVQTIRTVPSDTIRMGSQDKLITLN